MKGDAIGDEAINIRNLLRGWGYKSDIFVKNVSHEMCNEVIFMYERVAYDADIVIYHYSGGDELYEEVSRCKTKKVLIYHNITPYQYFIGYDDNFAGILKTAREKLRNFTKNYDLVLADSEFNKNELVSYGFDNVKILPIMLDFKKYDITTGKINHVHDTGINHARILFVGRIASSKMIEDLLLVFYYYSRTVDPEGRLVIVGDYATSIAGRIYHHQLLKLMQELDIKGVYFAGKVTLEALVGYYRWSNVFLTMSKHEGFCVPLVEAMYMGVPVIANACCAIPETLGGAGILINCKTYSEIAELIHICIDDKDFRDGILHGQNKRLKDFNSRNVSEKLKSYLEQLLI